MSSWAYIAQFLRPLTDLRTTKGYSSAVSCSLEAQAAFRVAKEAVANLVLLAYPRTNVPTYIMVDASRVAVGVILQQLVDTEWRPLGFFYRKLQLIETHYGIFDRELLAIYSIHHLRHIRQSHSPTQLLQTVGLWPQKYQAKFARMKVLYEIFNRQKNTEPSKFCPTVQPGKQDKSMTKS